MLNLMAFVTCAIISRLLPGSGMDYSTRRLTCSGSLQPVDLTGGYCWPTPKYRNWYAQHAFFEGKKAESTSPRKSTLRTLKLGRLRARSFRPFLPAPRRTGQDTYRIIRLSGFLVSLTVAVYRSLG